MVGDEICGAVVSIRFAVREVNQFSHSSLLMLSDIDCYRKTLSPFGIGLPVIRSQLIAFEIR